MENPKVSVIIPIYNVAMFINSGMEAFMRQRYADYEILLVDDGSTDDSPALCDAWAAKCTNIRVFHKENGGSGSARNLGIENAQGEYIYFFDIDDKADEELLAYCVETADKTQADLLVFSYHNYDVTIHHNYDILLSDITINSNAELREVYVDEFVMKMNGFPWNKFYRKSFLNAHNIRFEDLLIQQDEVFNLSLYPYVQKAVISSRPLYTYYVYSRGNTRSRFIPQRFDIYCTVNQRFRKLIDYWHLEDERLTRFLYNRFWSSTLEGLVQNLTSDKCIWSSEQKQKEMNHIADDRLTQEALSDLYTAAGFEQRMYMSAVRQRSIPKLLIWKRIFQTLRKVKQMF